MFDVVQVHVSANVKEELSMNLFYSSFLVYLDVREFVLHVYIIY